LFVNFRSAALRAVRKIIFVSPVAILIWVIPFIRIKIKTMKIKKIIIVVLVATLLFGCKRAGDEKKLAVMDESLNFNREKAAILETLHSETAAAFERDYESWKTKWVHDPNITKTYVNFVDSTFSESIGWDEISNFVKVFIENNPVPEPIPELIQDIDVRLYGDGAWVSFEQNDSLRGLKRETRLMEKIDGTWKIAGMQTSIYGFSTKE